MNLGLLDVDELPGTGGTEGDDDRKRLRDAEPDIGDADEIPGTSAVGPRHSTDAELDLCIVDAFRLDFPGEAE